MSLDNPFKNVLTQPAEPRPDNGACQCGSTLEPFALFGKWRTPHECAACYEVGRIRDHLSRIPGHRPMIPISRMFEGATTESYQCPPGDPKARDVFATWKPHAPKGIYLWGGKGQGKSHLAYALANRLLHVSARSEDPSSWGVRVDADIQPAVAARLKRLYPDGMPGHGWRVEAASVSAILAHMKRQYSEGRSADLILDRLITADVLVLDDLGTEKPTDWVREQLFLVINSRYEECRPMIITSNYAPGSVGHRLAGREDDGIGGGRIASRLVDACEVVEIHARGDYRTRPRG